MSQSIDAALSDWREALGERSVITSTSELDRASTATFPTDSSILAIVRPTSHEQVQRTIEIANRFEIPLYPTSRGCNWGLGSRVPPRSAVLLDLSRMDQIVDYDERLGYLVLQPGVTFQQACDFLRAQQSPFFLPVTGGSPHGSVIGNIAERGEGAGPYGQRVDYIANIRAVLANGDTVCTGFGPFPDCSARHLHRHGVGPSLDGLLAQSNMGVITQLTVWLTPHPQTLRTFIAYVTRRDQLELAVDASRELLLHRVVEANGIGLWNSHKMGATIGGYPWEAMGGMTPVDPARFPSEPWLIGGAIYGASTEIAEASGQMVQQRLQGCTDDWQWCNTDTNNVYLGVPTEQNVRSAYWRKKQGLPAQIDPDGDSCGLIWMCFAIPLVGSELRAAFDAIEPLMFGHGFEPNIGISCVSGRCAHLYVSLIYDRDVSGEDDRAVACHHAVVQALQQQGHLPYRLSLLSMASLPECSDQTQDCLQSIKRVLDPNSILAPGRYDAR